jgi:Methyltransferase domain
MASADSQLDPDRGDPRRYGFSLAQMAELLLACLDAVGARSVAEIGAYAGGLTRVLVDWAAGSGSRVCAIDPAPEAPLVELDRASENLELIRKTSLEALAEIALPDVVIIDGDHNYFTVAGELRAIALRSAGAVLPLLIFHDVGWPHGRRDDYFDPAQIPDRHRHPLAGERGGLFPGEPGLRAGGLSYPRSAAHEGGPRNGVLTAIEDFIAGHADLRLAVVPAFFGFGVLWHSGRRGGDELERILGPWDRNPILARLEAARVYHLAESHRRQVSLGSAQARQARQEAVLRRLLQSSAFGLAERLSGLRVRAGVAPWQPPVGKEAIRRALADDPRSPDAASR